MTALLATAAGLVGLCIGSFLTVVTHRVPRGESVVAPRSRCACGAPVANRANVPVLSWLLMGGRARCCRAPIPARYPLLELSTAAGFALAVPVAQSTRFGLWLLPALLYLVALSLALAVIDCAVHRLPNALVLPSYPVLAGLLAMPALATGDLRSALRALAGGLILYGVYFALAVLRPGGMGFGDVKLAGLLGGFLGLLGWPALVVGGFGAFLVGGLAGVVLMAGRRASRATRIPFGPSMLVAAWAGVVVGGPVADWYLGLTGLT